MNRVRRRRGRRPLRRLGHRDADGPRRAARAAARPRPPRPRHALHPRADAGGRAAARPLGPARRDRRRRHARRSPAPPSTTPTRDEHVALDASTALRAAADRARPDAAGRGAGGGRRGADSASTSRGSPATTPAASPACRVRGAGRAGAGRACGAHGRCRRAALRLARAVDARPTWRGTAAGALVYGYWPTASNRLPLVLPAGRRGGRDPDQRRPGVRLGRAARSGVRPAASRGPRAGPHRRARGRGARRRAARGGRAGRTAARVPRQARRAAAARGPGWALVGDAGSFKDPLTAHGITDALRDAELLARAARRRLTRRVRATTSERATRSRCPCCGWPRRSPVTGGTHRRSSSCCAPRARP